MTSSSSSTSARRSWATSVWSPPSTRWPTVSCADDPSFDRCWNEPRRTTAGAIQLTDYFLDATHLPFVHTTTFGVADDAFLPPHEVERGAWHASTTYVTPYRNYDDPLVATGEHPLVQEHHLFKEFAAATTALVRLTFPLTGGVISILFSCLPEDGASSRVFKMMARNDFGGDEVKLADSIQFEERVLDEDLAILESYRGPPRSPRRGTFFVDKTDHSPDVLRVNWYQRADGSPAVLPGQQRMGAHTDYGVLTILLADRVPGLEIVAPGGDWVGVQPEPGCFLVNLGDLLAQWTNDRWRSTLHRVVPPTGVGECLRRSAAFFHEANSDALVEVLPTCVTADRPARYEPVLAGDHLLAKLRGSRELERSTAVSTLGERAKVV
jgi:hypothetical protein